MKQQLTQKSRNELKNEMSIALNKKIQKMPTELKEILLDDLVTAFENRYVVLSHAQLGMTPDRKLPQTH